MNARKKREDSCRSGLTRNRLFGALGHVHNPFSANSHRDYYLDDYRKDENIGNPRAMNLQLEVAKAEAYFIAYNMVARLQKS